MGDDKTANMMKFVLVALALSAIATQATSTPNDQVDAVVPEEEFKEQSAFTCKKPCADFWKDEHAKCTGADVLGTTEADKYNTCANGAQEGLDAWNKCFAEVAGYDFKKVSCCGTHDRQCRTPAEDTAAGCAGSCEGFWKSHHEACLSQTGQAKYDACTTKSYLTCAKQLFWDPEKVAQCCNCEA